MNANKYKKELGKIEEEEKQVEQDRQREQYYEDLKNYDGEDRVVAMTEILDKAIKEGKDKIPRMKTGFSMLDDILGGGFAKGELVMIGGFPNHGKTPFMINLMANNLEEENNLSLFLSFEIRPEQLAIKYANAFNKNPNVLSFYTPIKNMERNIEWIQQRIIEAKVKFNVSCIFIDHLDFITKLNQGDSEERAIRECIMELKSFAVQEDILIVLAAHIKRLDTGTKKAPEMTDFKGSSAIEGNADFCLMVHKIPDVDDNNDVIEDAEGEPLYRQCRSKIYVRKNRNTGQLDAVKLKHNVETKLFTPLEEKYENTQQPYQTKEDLLK